MCVSLNGEYTPLARLAKISYTHCSMRTTTSALRKMKTTAILGREDLMSVQSALEAFIDARLISSDISHKTESVLIILQSCLHYYVFVC